MMRRLWVQLSIAFSLVVLLSAILLIFLIVTYAEIERQDARSGIIAAQNPDWLYGEDGIVVLLQNHFTNGGSVDGAITILVEFEKSAAISPNQNLRLSLISGEIVHGQLESNSTYGQVVFENSVLEYTTRQSPDSGSPPGTIAPINLFAFLGGVGVIMGCVFGVIISRWLVAPLSRLADIVRQVGGRNFNLRIEPQGSVEIQDLARAFNEMAAQLETSEKLRNNLVADVAHELRTPLTVMLSNLRALIDDLYPLTKTEILTLFDQTQHLNRLVNDLHELSLADAQELTILQESVNLNELLNSIAEIFKPVAEAENIDFTIEIPRDPLLISGDRIRLRQVTQNLLVNALRHTPPRGKITLRLESQGKKVYLRIADTGEGIPTEHLSYVFERFYRADKSRNRADGGTGLGLAIGKAIIEAHGGEISVDSQTTVPSGTCFTILLPLNHTNPVIARL